MKTSSWIVFTILILPLLVQSVYSFELDTSSYSLKQQIKEGWDIESFFCHNDQVLILKITDESPACVNPETKEKLLERGWAILTPKERLYDIEKTLNDKDCLEFGGWLDEFVDGNFNENHLIFDLPVSDELSQRIYDFIPYCIDNDNDGFFYLNTKHFIDFDTIDFSKTINANNQFAFDYYAQVNENQNIFFSPWSITSAFAIVNEGAKGNTADEIQNVFGLTENSKEQFKEINKILNQENPGYTIEVANSLWLAQDFTLHSDYVDTVQTYYDGVIEKVDFADDGTDVINGWVSDKTRQKIPELFSPPLDPNTRLVIANAIYFNGTWSMPFDEKNTRDDKFIISPGVEVTVPFMNKDSSYNHTKTDELQIIELPYEGNGASMLILLPERIDGMESLEEQLTAENLEKWRSEMTKSRLFLQIPKFTLETEYNLVKDLMTLGIIDAFGPADFSGISSESLFIDRAVHKAFVDVNEKGTEAAAATGIAMVESMPPTFRADHPFVFIILDNETGNVLFLGKVVDPSQ